MILSLVGPEDPILRQVCILVTDPAKEVLPYLSGMRNLLLRNYGAGLAAPQVGIPRRFFIMRGGFFGGRQVVINPKIIWRGGSVLSEREGCLSKPEFVTFVPRPTEIRARWEDESGAFHSDKLTGYIARIFQHECDHLNGRLIF